MFLQVKYAHKVYPHSVHVYETCCAGACVKISARDTAGNWHVLWKTATPTLITSSRIFCPPIVVRRGSSGASRRERGKE